jgi:hypothetical protein
MRQPVVELRWERIFRDEMERGILPLVGALSLIQKDLFTDMVSRLRRTILEEPTKGGWNDGETRWLPDIPA